MASSAPTHPNRYAQNQDVAFTELTPSEGVLLNLRNQRYYSLNETGVAIWKSLDQPRDAEEIARGLSREFEVSEADALGFVRSFLNELAGDGLVERSS